MKTINPCCIILIFLHILVSRNHTKTHTFFWFLVLIDLNTSFYSRVSLFFSFLLLIKYLKIFLLYDVMLLCCDSKGLLFASVLKSLMSLCFLTFSIVFLKTTLFIKSFFFSKFLQKLLVFLRSVFISIYGFSQAFPLNLVTLCTFFNPNP